ncbi:MAG: glycine cleavage system aminomethyltransferase GcvT [Firmicutes bacterium]|nr:glycine cleavage system aminomethyltransferase GcvT [Bacillota bacterium]
MENLNKTPLYQQHVDAGGKIVDFGGWALPVQYSGILEEIDAVRNRAGLFDVSHMGEIVVGGEKALDWLQSMLTNDIGRLVDGQVMYTLMCYPDGGVVDDLLVYRFNAQKFLLVVNAANAEKDWLWLQQHCWQGIQLENTSDTTAQLALQGPEAEAILQKITDIPLDQLGFFRFVHEANVAGRSCLISRTGYTGEDGFEIYCRPDVAAPLWEAIMEAGKDKGLLPAGLGSRDTLRFEANLPLYGHEISPEISPLEAGLGFFVKLKKEADYIGKQALIAQKEAGLKRRLRGLEMLDRGIPRAEYPVYNEAGDQIGVITTGSFSPTVGKNIANALMDTSYIEEGTTVLVGVRNRRLKAKVVKLPFYKREAK